MTGEDGRGSAIVAIEGLTMRYGSLAALDRVSLSVGRGLVYALLGRNGAGKTSLVRCLLGQQKATDGKPFLFGRDAWKSRAKAMEKVGVVPEEPDAPPEMTATQLSAFCARLYLSWDAAGVEARCRRFGVPMEVPFGRLSKGQKGQVALALALASSPELLVLDDPTLGLDAVARKEVFEELIGELADRNVTIFVTTHDLAGIEGIADRVGILQEGKLALDEEMEALKTRFRRIRYGNVKTEERTEYGKELDLFDAVRAKVRGWGVEAVVADYDEAKFERFAKTGGVVDAEVEALSLEEIFIAVVGERREGRS